MQQKNKELWFDRLKFFRGLLIALPISIILWLLLYNICFGATYYVDSSVTDTHVASATPDFTTYNPTTFATDTGSSSVFKTVADLNACTFAADDQILFRKGQTWREQLTVPSSGTSGHPITFDTFGSGDKPKIERIYGLAKDYITVQNLDVMGSISLNGANNLVKYISFSTDTYAYGVTYNETTDAYTRTGDNAALAVGSSPGDNFLPIQRKMKRCVMRNDGTINYYLSATDSTKKWDGSAADLIGTDGQVMVEIPKFYYTYSYASNVHSYSVSLAPLPGYTLHPAFTKAGATVNYRYIGAYEAYTATGSKLASVSERMPTVSQTIATFRTRTTNRGAGWHQLDFNLVSAIQLLYLVEYADFDSQAMIGAGVTAYAAWPNAPQCLSGNSNSIGNATGNLTITVSKWAASSNFALNDEKIPLATQNGYTYQVTTDNGSSGSSEPTWPTTIGNTIADGNLVWICIRHPGYMTYRGIENWYGHIWKFVDGISVHNSTANGSRAWTCGNYTQFAADTETNYTLVTNELAPADGYARIFCPIISGFLPKSVSGGSSSTGMADYYYTSYDGDHNSGWRMCVLGGPANSGAYVGAFYWASDSASSYLGTHVGGRLVF